MPSYIQSLIQAARVEVNFDPNDAEHMEVARIMFMSESRPLTSRTAEDAARLQRYEADLKKRKGLKIRFRLEPPYHDVRTMVMTKVFGWAIQIHNSKALHNIHSITEKVRPGHLTKA